MTRLGRGILTLILIWTFNAMSPFEGAAHQTVDFQLRQGHLVVVQVSVANTSLNAVIDRIPTPALIDGFRSPILQKDGLLRLTALKLKGIQFDFQRSVLSWAK